MIPLKLAPSGSNELAPYVYRKFTRLKWNDDLCSVFSRSAIHSWETLK